MRLSIGVSALAAVLLAPPVPAWALTPAVHDEAGFFTADAVTKADAIIKDIKERHGKDLLIETFPAPPAGKEDEAKGDDGKANPRFFAAWALQRARAQHVNGIYVLICKEPPYIQPAVGNQTHTLFTDYDRSHLGKILIDHFEKREQKEYDDGLLEAVRYVQSTLNQNDSSKAPNKEAEGQAPSRQGPDRWPTTGGGHSTAPAVGGLPLGLGGCLCVGLVVIGVLAAGAMVVSALFRSFGHGPGGYGPGPGGYGPGGPGGYGGYGGQGGGFMSSILGGLFGGAAGSWAYDRFFGGHSSPNQGPGPGPNVAPPSAPAPDDTSYTAGGGGDFGGGDSGGGDSGGGGDFGGGGGDAGGGGGGGDFGGGGGDAGGGGGF